ncbi:Uncharacterized protein QTN25_006897 [Entamoeba marina]
MMKAAAKDNQNILKRKSKGLEAIQQSVLIGFLNTIGYEFQFKKPERLAIQTLQTFNILDVFLNSKSVHFGVAVSEICDNAYNKNKDIHVSTTNSKALQKRMSTNRASSSFNLLVKIAEQNGFMFTIKSSKQPTKTIKMNKFSQVTLPSGDVFSLNDMVYFGTEVNKHISTLLTKGEKIVNVHSHDSQLILLLNRTIKELNECKNDVFIFSDSDCETNELHVNSFISHNSRKSD